MTASAVQNAPTVGLPAPKIRLWQGDGTTVQTADAFPSTNATVAVTPLVRVQAVILNVPESIITGTTFDLRLELLHYRRRKTSANSLSGSGLKEASYRHPSNAVAVSGNGSHTHGGDQGGISPAVQAIRQSEWPVTAHGQVIDVTAGMHAFMALGQVRYRDPAGVEQTFLALMPCGRSSPSMNNRQRYPYSPTFYPGYYRFRLSVIDPSDPRGQRLTGPASETVSLTNHIFPFRPDAPVVDPSNPLELVPTATLRGDFSGTVTRAWIGSVSRLPTS